jgi:hypothetical protein
MPENVNLFHFELNEGGQYAKFSAECSDSFDAVVVEGGDRVNCIIS